MCSVNVGGRGNTTWYVMVCVVKKLSTSLKIIYNSLDIGNSDLGSMDL